MHINNSITSVYHGNVVTTYPKKKNVPYFSSTRLLFFKKDAFANMYIKSTYNPKKTWVWGEGEKKMSQYQF